MYGHRYTRQQTRVPGIALLLLLVAIVGGMSLFFNRAKSPQNISQVQTHAKIERLDVVNVRDRSATIFWQTEKPSTGYVVYGNTPESLAMKAYDELDQSVHQSPRSHHVVQVKGLKPNADFFFKLYVDGAEVGQSGTIAYSSKTSRVLPTNSGLEPVYGDIVRVNGAPEKNAIVLLTIGESKPLLTRTGKDGTFLFSLCCVLNSQNNEPMYPTEDEAVRIHIISEDGIEKTEEGLFADVSPLKEALVIDTALTQLENTPVDESEPQVLAVSDSIEKVSPVDIVYPKENAVIPGFRPLVRGVGEPGSPVKGTFKEMGRIFQTTIDEKRNWLYQPSFNFSPGIHELEIETFDTLGNSVSMSRSFTILKSGEAVLGDATGSATITPSINVTATPSAQPTLEPTLVFATSTATSTPPVSGGSVLPFTILSLVLLVIGAGIILLF